MKNGHKICLLYGFECWEVETTYQRMTVAEMRKNRLDRVVMYKGSLLMQQLEN